MKVVLLDYGRVVAPEDGAPVIQSVYGALPDDKESSDLFGSLAHDLAKGLIDESRVKDLLEERGHKIPEDYDLRWKNTIERHLRPSDEMVALIEVLKRRGFTVALLSNVWPRSAKIICSNGWYDTFDSVYLSCEMGLAKPDPLLYDKALEDLRVAADDILFVDDKEKNLVYPKKLGMHVLCVASPGDAAKQVRKYLNIR